MGALPARPLAGKITLIAVPATASDFSSGAGVYSLALAGDISGLGIFVTQRSNFHCAFRVIAMHLYSNSALTEANHETQSPPRLRQAWAAAL